MTNILVSNKTVHLPYSDILTRYDEGIRVFMTTFRHFQGKQVNGLNICDNSNMFP